MPSSPTRRSVLVGGAAVASAAVAACTATPVAAPTAAPPTGLDTAVPHPPGPPPSAVGSAGTRVAAAADVPVGGGVVVNGVLIVQPESGTFKAYNAACPHQGVQLGAPQNDVVTCPAHHSKFKADDGSLISGPATHGLTAIAVTVQGADIVRA